jgi:hypothetical protein
MAFDMKRVRRTLGTIEEINANDAATQEDIDVITDRLSVLNSEADAEMRRLAGRHDIGDPHEFALKVKSGEYNRGNGYGSRENMDEGGGFWSWLFG